MEFEAPTSRVPAKVINLMDALRSSVKAEQPTKTAKRDKKRIEGQREMLLPIPGKKGARKLAVTIRRRILGNCK
jgi:DNA end-binding protein Ku